MLNYSPYLLNESPNNLALVLGQKKLTPSGEEVTEHFDVTISLNGNPVWNSGWLSLNALRHFERTHRVPAERGHRIKVKLGNRTSYKGNWLQVYAPLQFRTTAPSRGWKSVVVSGANIQVSPVLKLLRRRVARLVNPPSAKPIRSRLSSTLRPSPQIINIPFLKVTEVGNKGTLFPAQSGRLVIPRLLFRRDWTGTRTPGYGSMKHRQLPVNPHTVSMVDVTDDRYCRYTVNATTGDHSLDCTTFSDRYFVPAPPFTHYQPFVDAAANIALKRLVRQAQSGVQANFAQNLAQLNQTVGLIATNATKIANSLRALRKLNFAGAVSALKSGTDAPFKIRQQGLSALKPVASNWLQLQYGWKPLLKDIEEAIQLLPESFDQGNTVCRVTSSGTVKWSDTLPFPPGDAVIGASKVGVTTQTARTTVKYGISYRLEDAALQYFAQLGFTNPINLAWEVLPFSFVVDWFLPIGSWLESLSNFHGLVFLDGFKTTFTKWQMDSANFYGGPVSGVPQSTVNFGCTYRHERNILTRQRLTSFPSASAPTLVVNPFYNTDKGSVIGNRASNAVALMIQVFSR